MKLYVDKMAIWLNDKLTKWQVDEMPSRTKDKLMKWSSTFGLSAKIDKQTKKELSAKNDQQFFAINVVRRRRCVDNEIRR